MAVEKEEKSCFHDILELSNERRREKKTKKMQTLVYGDFSLLLKT